MLWICHREKRNVFDTLASKKRNPEKYPIYSSSTSFSDKDSSFFYTLSINFLKLVFSLDGFWFCPFFGAIKKKDSPFNCFVVKAWRMAPILNAPDVVWQSWIIIIFFIFPAVHSFVQNVSKLGLCQESKKPAHLNVFQTNSIKPSPKQREKRKKKYLGVRTYPSNLEIINILSCPNIKKSLSLRFALSSFNFGHNFLKKVRK